MVCDESGKTSLWTREKRRIEMPNNLRGQLDALKLPNNTVLDGEIWNPLKRGSWRHDKSVRCLLTLWDAVRIGDNDVSDAPIEDRYAGLKVLLGQTSNDVTAAERLPATPEAVEAVRAEAKAHWESEGLRSGFVHGVVMKRRGSPRRDHCSRSVEHADWMKIVFW